MPKRTVAGTPADPVSSGYVNLDLRESELGEFKLRFDFNAIAHAESLTGLNLLVGMATTVLNGMSGSQMRGLLYGALRANHPKMTPDDAGNLIRLDTCAAIQAALKDCYLAAMPEKKRMEIQALAELFSGLPTPNSGSTSGASPEFTSDSPTPNSIV